MDQPMAASAKGCATCGPARARLWPRSSSAERIIQASLAAVLAAGLALGLALTPDPAGHGTHTALGLPPCGMLVVTGRPCPTCGVTTAFALAVRGRFQEALITQPMGLVTFLGMAGALLVLVAALATGRSCAHLVTPHSVTAAVVLLTALGVVSWIYKWSVM